MRRKGKREGRGGERREGRSERKEGLVGRQELDNVRATYIQSRQGSLMQVYHNFYVSYSYLRCPLWDRTFGLINQQHVQCTLLLYRGETNVLLLAATSLKTGCYRQVAARKGKCDEQLLQGCSQLLYVSTMQVVVTTLPHPHDHTPLID